MPDQTHPAVSLINLLESMKGRPLWKMKKAAANTFRAETLDRFRLATNELFARALADIPGVAPGTYLPFLDARHCPLPGWDVLVATMAVIPATRRDEFSVAGQTQDGVFELLEETPATLEMGLLAEDNRDADPKALAYLALQCNRDPAQERVQGAIQAAITDVQAACAGVSRYAVFSHLEAEVADANPPDIAAAMSKCIKKVRRVAKQQGNEWLEPFGLELNFTADTTPAAVLKATTVLARLFHAVAEDEPRSKMALGTFAVPASRIAH